MGGKEPQLPFLYKILFFLNQYQLLFYMISLTIIIVAKKFVLPVNTLLWNIVLYSMLALMATVFTTNIIITYLKARAERILSGKPVEKLPRSIRIAFTLALIGIAVGVYVIFNIDKILGFIILFGSYLYMRSAFKSYEALKEGMYYGYEKKPRRRRVRKDTHGESKGSRRSDKRTEEGSSERGEAKDMD